MVAMTTDDSGDEIGDVLEEEEEDADETTEKGYDSVMGSDEARSKRGLFDVVVLSSSSITALKRREG